MMSELMVEVMRAGVVESRHFGDLAVVGSDGTLLYALGDPNRVTFARSAAKPLQAIPAIETGAADAFGLTDEEIAVTCGSHEGEPYHTEVVERLLKRLSLDEGALHCGVHPPYRDDVRAALALAGREATAVHNNCSGKHAGFLATATHLGEPLDTYIEASHPVQSRILDVISDMTEVPRENLHCGVDGCGIPAPALPIRNLAHAFAKMVRPSTLSETRAAAVGRIVKSMMQYPFLVGGTDRLCTQFIGVGRGEWFGKAGAEGVYCVGSVRYGWGLCFKIDDGNERALAPVVVEALRQLGALSEDQLSSLAHLHRPVIRNRAGLPVGELRPSFQLDSQI